MRRYNKRRKYRQIRCIMVFLLFILIAVAVYLAISNATKAYSPANYRQSRDNNASSEWNLLLVNSENALPEDNQVTLFRLSNGIQVDERIYPALQEMFDAARTEGLSLTVVAGYRTSDEQQQLLTQKIEEYQNEGYSTGMANELAKKWVAVPGTSEHQLGIAVDINADTTRSSNDAVYDWLANHSYKYGFIKRYPENKTKITGVINEPWHYRYVGQEAASEIYAKDLCLEEYLTP